MRSSGGAYYPKLDQLRALAVLMVFAWHFLHHTIPFGYTPVLPPLSLLVEGHTGVALFMTLSGYLFAKITDGQRIDYGRFLWNRLIRLAPLLLVVFCYAATFDGFGIAQAVRGLVFPSWPYGGWSIATELHFYLVFPLLLAVQRRGGVLSLALVLWLAIAARGVYWLEQGSVHKLAYFTLAGRIDQFVCGMMAFQLSQSRAFRRHATLVLLAAATVFVAGWHLFTLAGSYMRMPDYPSPSPLWIVLPTFEATAYGLIIAGFECSPAAIGGAPGRLLAKVGEASYSIYLWHRVLLEIILTRITPDRDFPLALAQMIVAFAGVAVLGWLSYQVIERPFLRLRCRYLAPARTGEAVPRRELTSQPS